VIRKRGRRDRNSFWRFISAMTGGAINFNGLLLLVFFLENIKNKNTLSKYKSNHTHTHIVSN